MLNHQRKKNAKVTSRVLALCHSVGLTKTSASMFFTFYGGLTPIKSFETTEFAFFTSLPTPHHRFFMK